MEKNGIYEGRVEGLGSDGEGIIKYEGATVFVPFCLVGEKVRFKALKVKGNVAKTSEPRHIRGSIRPAPCFTVAAVAICSIWNTPPSLLLNGSR